MSVEPNTEYIQSKVLKDFQQKANSFYEGMEKEFLRDVRSKLTDGTVDVQEENIKELSLEYAKKFEEHLKTSKKVEKFISSYVNDTFDLVCDSMQEGVIEREEAEVVFNILKHILTGGKMHLDEQTQVQPLETKKKPRKRKSK